MCSGRYSKSFFTKQMYKSCFCLVNTKWICTVAGVTAANAMLNTILPIQRYFHIMLALKPHEHVSIKIVLASITELEKHKWLNDSIWNSHTFHLQCKTLWWLFSFSCIKLSMTHSLHSIWRIQLEIRFPIKHCQWDKIYTIFHWQMWLRLKNCVFSIILESYLNQLVQMIWSRPVCMIVIGCPVFFQFPSHLLSFKSHVIELN